MIRALRHWAFAVSATVLVALVLDVAHVPTPALLGAVIAGIAVALVLPVALELPRWPVHVAQGVLGIAAGSYMRSSTLGAIGAHWLPVVLVCVATLVLSVVFGLVFAAVSPVDAATASVGLIAGGAAGIVSISSELGADDRVVVVLQYMRVLLIVTFMPIVAAVVFHPSSHSAAAGAAHASAASGLLFAFVCLAAGLPLGQLMRVPAGALIGPMLVAAVLAGAGWSRPLPDLLQNIAFGIVGLQVGLRFTPASLRAVGSILPLATVFIVTLLVTCALLGVLLARLAHVGELDGYLATTPGGLYAVLATAVTGNANAAFVLAVQLLRTFLMLLAAPILVRRLLVGRVAVANGCSIATSGSGER